MTAIVETPNLLMKHHLSILVRSLALILAFTWLGARAAETPSYPPPKFPDASGWGKNVQRTMRLWRKRNGRYGRWRRILT